MKARVFNVPPVPGRAAIARRVMDWLDGPGSKGGEVPLADRSRSVAVMTLDRFEASPASRIAMVEEMLALGLLEPQVKRGRVRPQSDHWRRA
jgi:hypothetical protein